MKINEIIVVEGKYDKIKLDSILTDSVVITTNGFGIFKDKEKREFLRKYAKERGIVILTDSDSAGFVIRNHIKNIVPNQYIKNAYIPEIKGKEKRKNEKSKEGLLGVEGIDGDIILDAFKRAGCNVDEKSVPVEKITLKDLYNDGFSGKTESKEKRTKLLKELDLPVKMSTTAMLDIINTFVGKDKYNEIVKRL